MVQCIASWVVLDFKKNGRGSRLSKVMDKMSWMYLYIVLDLGILYSNPNIWVSVNDGEMIFASEKYCKLEPVNCEWIKCWILIEWTLNLIVTWFPSKCLFHFNTNMNFNRVWIILNSMKTPNSTLPSMLTCISSNTLVSWWPLHLL